MIDQTRTRDGDVWFRHCPRCGGDVAISEDHYGAYLRCLQCGWHRD